MSFDKPKVTIDLEEYNSLLNKIKEKSKELDYDEAYSELIEHMLVRKLPMEEFNRLNNKYEVFANLGSFGNNKVNFKIRLKENK